MGKERIERVDSDTKLYFIGIKEDIIKAVEKIVDDKNKDLEKYITKVYDTRLQNIEKDIVRHDKYHEEHFNEDKLTDGKINSAFETLRKEIIKNSRFRWQYLLMVIPVIISIIAMLNK